MKAQAKRYFASYTTEDLRTALRQCDEQIEALKEYTRKGYTMSPDLWVELRSRQGVLIDAIAERGE